ncbi:MAG: class III extradiol ring-cleavage dioxygenase [Archangium sp.]|nr:class III extradiol ring-cleavage dioxygenase [Archangium sp.]
MTTSSRMPVVFLPHGGGPWPFVDVGFGDPKELDQLATYLKSVGAVPETNPRAVLMISAHWEASVPTVMTSAHPPMLYDYSGFPPESYRITWPAPGDPEFAKRVRAVLEGAGIPSAEDPARGFDHGAFVPLKLAWPEAEVPTLQLSLKRGLDPATHLAIGRALAPLRDEGVFIIGSGMTFHNMRGFGAPDSMAVSQAFDRWLQHVTIADQPERDAQLTKWEAAPAARLNHPREEHLLPLMVIAGAAGSDRGSVSYSSTLMGVRLSAFRFG